MEMDFYDYFLSWLWNIEPIKLHKLVEAFGGAKNLFHAGSHELSKLEAAHRNAILKVKQKDELYRTWENRERESFEFISWRNERYPKRLLELKDYPYGIYIEGSISNILSGDRPVVAMVGARNCTEYGRELAYKTAVNLARNRIHVVSGLAGGIDGAGPRGCLDGGGYTLGILGSGIHTIYPRENYDLYIQMKKRGGILSEYPPDLKPMSYLFPRRNRMISVLADFVLVVEAKEKSGSLITVDFALEQGRDIGAVPGRPCDLLSSGCNHLLQQGAKCILSADDILEELFDTMEMKKVIKNDAEVNKDLGLAPKEKIVYSCLRLEPIFIDEVLCRLNMPVWECIQILTELEIKGLIRQNPHQYYYRI